MSVRKRPESQFYQYRFKHRGIPYEGSTQETKKGAALKVEAIIRAKVIRGEMRRELRDIPTLGEFSVDFLSFTEARQDIKTATKRSYRNGWRILRSTPIVKLRLNEVGASDVSTLVLPGSGSNQNQALRALSATLSYACEKDWIKAAPRISLRHENKRRAIIADVWLEETLLSLASTTLRDFMVIMLDSGMRPEEIARLRWTHIRWASKAIEIHAGKSPNAERSVGLSERMTDVLRARRNKSEWVFPCKVTKEGKQVSASGHVNATAVGGKMWGALKYAYEVRRERDSLPALPEDLVLYSCRHTFATRFLEASGNNKAALKEIMGHSSFSISERYIHPGVANSAEIIDRFNAESRKPKALEKRA